MGANLAQIPKSQLLSLQRSHLNGVSECKLVVDVSLFIVFELVIDDAQVDVSEEFAGVIADLLEFGVEFDGFFVKRGVGFGQDLVVNTYAVVGEGFSVLVAYEETDFEELAVVVDSLGVFAKVVTQNTLTVVRPALILLLARPLARKSQQHIILQPLLRIDSVIATLKTYGPRTCRIHQLILRPLPFHKINLTLSLSWSD